MSLDIYLEGEPYKEKCWCHTCDHKHEHTVTPELFWQNITHNLNKMADAAGIYGVVWRPEENGINKASDLIAPLETAIADMRERPEFYKKFNSPNGWGMYEDFVPWLERLVEACREYPYAKVRASR